VTGVQRSSMPPVGWAGWLARIALPLLLLNALLTLENHGPGLWPRPALRLSFELVVALVALAGWVAWRGTAGAWALRLLSAASAFWIVARYFDVTVSAVFGRQLNLYWDSRHALEVLRMGEFSVWQIGLAALAMLAVPLLLYRLSLHCWRAIAQRYSDFLLYPLREICRGEFVRRLSRSLAPAIAASWRRSTHSISITSSLTWLMSRAIRSSGMQAGRTILRADRWSSHSAKSETAGVSRR